MEYGDYLLWSHPGLPVFVAGHAHLVPEEVWRDYLSTIRGGAGWLGAGDLLSARRGQFAFYGGVVEP